MKIGELWRKIPAKFWIAVHILCIILCIPLIYTFAGSPVFSVQDAYRRAEKANLVGPGEIHGKLKLEDADYKWLILASNADGVMLYAYDGAHSEKNEFFYLEKTGSLTLAAAPGDELLWVQTEANLPLFLFDEYSDAVRAELELTISAEYQGESSQKTYCLEARRENPGYFQFDLSAKRGGGLGAEGYGLYMLRNVLGYSMADTLDISFPAVVRLYDEAGVLLKEAGFTVQSAAARVRATQAEGEDFLLRYLQITWKSDMIYKS